MSNVQRRFFIHLSIQRFASSVVQKYGCSRQCAILFPSHNVASRCADFVLKRTGSVAADVVQIIDLVSANQNAAEGEIFVSPAVSAVLFPEEYFSAGKEFWQHSGEGISSRRADYCHSLFQEGILVDQRELLPQRRLSKVPRRYRRKISVNSQDQSNGSAETDGDTGDHGCYIEERFGRNLELSFSSNAKVAIRRRIAGSLTADVDLQDALQLGHDESRKRPVCGFSDHDVYVYPSGMSAIFNTHRSLLVAKGQLKSISYGQVVQICYSMRVLNLPASHTLIR
jgi:cystathionine gamma-synthase